MQSKHTRNAEYWEEVKNPRHGGSTDAAEKEKKKHLYDLSEIAELPVATIFSEKSTDEEPIIFLDNTNDDVLLMLG